MLKEPQEIARLLEQVNPSWKEVRGKALTLIAKFDAKPFQSKCQGNHCGKLATRCSVHVRNIDSLLWWCDTCDHSQYGADAGQVQQLRKYLDALHHVAFFCAGRENDYRTIIRALATAKGLPEKVSEKQAQEFFA